MKRKSNNVSSFRFFNSDGQSNSPTSCLLSHAGKDKDASDRGESWISQCAAWRESLGLPSDAKIWSHKMVATGLSATSRVKEILDLVAAEKLKKYGLSNVLRMSKEEKQELLRGVFCDVSQNPKFASYTNEANVTGCLATSTILYSYGRDRVVLPFEHLMFQGHRRGIVFPPEIKSTQIKTLAGEGMALPCLGSVIWAMYLLKGLP